MAFDKAEYQKEYMRKKRMAENGEPPYTWVKPTRDILEALEGKGRGCPSGGYVLISRDSNTEETIVSEEDWRARFDWTCKHGQEGWSCKRCLK